MMAHDIDTWIHTELIDDLMMYAYFYAYTYVL